jgi:hypothetical protein
MLSNVCLLECVCLQASYLFWRLLTLNSLFVFLVFHIHKEYDLWFDHYCLGMGMWPNQLA